MAGENAEKKESRPLSPADGKFAAELLQTKQDLIQSLQELDSALVPVVKKIEELAVSVQTESNNLEKKEQALSVRKKQVAKVNKPLLTSIKDNEDRLEQSGLVDAVSIFFLILSHASPHSSGTYQTREDAEKSIRSSKAQLIDTTSEQKAVMQAQKILQPYVDAQTQQLQTRDSIEKRKTFDVITNILLVDIGEEQIKEFRDLANSSGMSLDHFLNSTGELAKPFMRGNLTHEALETAIAWAKSKEGNFDLSPEEMVFKQYVNRQVIPNLGSFEIWASMVDDLNKTGTKDRQPLELLRQKPVTLSGKGTTRSLVPLDADAASTEARGMIAALPAPELDSIITANKSIGERIYVATKKNEETLRVFEDQFTGIEAKINGLLVQSADKYIQAGALAEQVRSAQLKNERLDNEIGRAKFELAEYEKLLPKDKPKSLRVLGRAAERSLEFAAIGGAGGSIIPAAGTAIGASGGAVIGFFSGAMEGLIENLTTRKRGLSKKGELEIRNELVDYLQGQKVDIEKHKQVITDLGNDIVGLFNKAHDTQQTGEKLDAHRIETAYVARMLLRSGLQNCSLLSDACEQHGIKSLDTFVGKFQKELHTALNRFCFGLANSNDMAVIIEESNALSGNQLKPHEHILKDFVENVMKPDVGAYLSKASKVDVISQANLLPYGAPLEYTRGIVKDGSQELAALVANEFGISVVGALDVKHRFDFPLHRHGDKQLYDVKLKDGQMVDEYPEKRVNVYQPEYIERFVDRTKQAMTHGNKNIPTVSDMFLRVCAYEYFAPQAVRTAGTNNIFAENPEAPAAYPMINTTVDNFIHKMQLGPIGEYRKVVGDRLDNVIAQAFIDYFATLGVMHSDDKKIKPSRKQLHNAGNSEDYGPVFSSYTRKVTADAIERFDLFLDIYKQVLQKHAQVWSEKDRATLEVHLAALPEPSKAILTPEIVKPGSHRARLLAAYEDHTLSNLLKRPDSEGRGQVR